MKKTTAINQNVDANSFAQSNKDAVIPAPDCLSDKKPVIPCHPRENGGQAGIQQKQHPAQRTKPLSRDARNTSTNWIPACAGMTQGFGRSGFNPTFRATSLILTLAAIGLATLPTTNAYANPQDGQVVAGSATIVQETAAKVGITQTTDKAIIDWRSFSIGAAEHVQFYQPSAASVTLNRVVGQDPSQILGRLTANGQVFLVNPNGIFFGRNAQIDVAGLVASTHNIRNEDFLAGRNNFNIPGNHGAAVINEGNIRIADTGIAAFVAPSVANRGVIAARLGKIMLASANGFTLDFTGDQLITFLVNDEVAQTAFDLEGNQLTSFVENAGRIEAQGGYVLLTAKAAENAIHGVINQTGSIEATTVGTHNGTIILNAGTGSLNVAGTLDASAPNDGDGGYIDTSGAHVTIDPEAIITTAAPSGKTGTWLIDPVDFTIAASGGDITGAALASYLAASNIEIQTLATGSSGNGDIFVNNAVTWNNTNKLTLTAHRNINVNAAINAAGGGSVKLRADSLGAGTGTVAFGGSGHITVNNGAAVGIYYNPTSYTNAGTKSDVNGNPYSGFVTLNGGSALTAYMLVNDVNQLQAIDSNLGGNYALGKDVDASATAGWNAGAGFTPLGDLTTRFTGVFDGLGYTISNLTINLPTTDNVGLFGYAGMGSVISNVGLVGGSVSGHYNVGGLVGNNFGTVNYSYATGSVSGSLTGVDYSGNAGGLAGQNNGTISNSYATGDVIGFDYVGGLVGGMGSVAGSGTVSKSYATGSVIGTGSNSEVGGLVGGSWYGTVSDSYATGSVSGAGFIGGLMGYNWNTISNSYATGSVSGTGNVGGLIGYNNSTYHNGTVSGSFWNSDVKVTGIGGGILTGTTGLTTAQIKQQASFNGWDFTNTWQIVEGISYPTQRVFNAGVGAGGGNILGPVPHPVIGVPDPTLTTPDFCVLSPLTCKSDERKPDTQSPVPGPNNPPNNSVLTGGIAWLNSDYLRSEVLPYANLSSAVYGNVQQFGGFTRIADENGFASGTEETESFHASAYIDNNGKVVIAFKGTNSWGDILANIRQLGTVPLEYTQALLFVQRVLAMGVAQDNIVVTGHSLGGGMAQYAALAFGLQAVTFNPAPLSSATINSATSINNGRGLSNITNYVVTSNGQEDLVASSVGGTLVGEVRHIELPAQSIVDNVVLGQGISRHSIDSFVSGVSALTQQ